MAHNRLCAEAMLRDCVCECQGSKHGWPGALKFAREESGARRIELRRRADDDWHKARRTPSGKQPTETRKAAATKTAAADIVYWLAQNPDAIHITETVGTILADTASGGLDGKLSSAGRSQIKKTREEHFWCDLAVAMANAIEDVTKRANKALDRVPDYAISLMLKSRASDSRSNIVDPLVRLAVHATWKSMRTAILQQMPFDPDKAVKAMRIIAILICPNPEIIAQCATERFVLLSGTSFLSRPEIG